MIYSKVHYKFPLAPWFRNVMTRILSYQLKYIGINLKNIIFFSVVWLALCVWFKRPQHHAVGSLQCAEWWHRGTVSGVDRCPQGLDLATGLLWWNCVLMFLGHNNKSVESNPRSAITLRLQVSTLDASVSSVKWCELILKISVIISS